MRDKNHGDVPLTRPEAAAIRKLRSPRERKAAQRFVVEGARCVREALQAGIGIHRAVVSPRLHAIEEGADVPPSESLETRLRARGVPVAHVTDRVLKTLSDTDTPQGIVLVGEEILAPLAILEAGFGVLVMDGIQDPGNVGTLIRSAHAFGCGGVVTLEGTADPWGAKAVRASAGSAFHIAVAKAAESELLSWARSTGVRLLAAAPGADKLEHPDGAWALLVGSEGRGLRTSLLEAADAVVSLAMPGGAESLNAAVAGSLLLHHLAVRQTSG